MRRCTLKHQLENPFCGKHFCVEFIHDRLNSQRHQRVYCTAQSTRKESNTYPSSRIHAIHKIHWNLRWLLRSRLHSHLWFPHRCWRSMDRIERELSIHGRSWNRQLFSHIHLSALDEGLTSCTFFLRSTERAFYKSPVRGAIHWNSVSHVKCIDVGQHHWLKIWKLFV